MNNFKCSIGQIVTNEDGNVIISFVTDCKKAKTVADELKSLRDGGKAVDISVSLHREKRSVRANAYMWELVGKIAECVGMTRDNVYRKIVRDVGVYRVVTINNAAVDTLITSWGLHGSAWIAERTDSCTDGFSDVLLYYGTSVYNTVQMSRIIDEVVSEAQALGIDTMSPKDIEEMKSLWKSASS